LQRVSDIYKNRPEELDPILSDRELVVETAVNLEMLLKEKKLFSFQEECELHGEDEFEAI